MLNAFNPVSVLWEVVMT